MTVLLIRSALLEGSLLGIKYYLTPNWERLRDAKVSKEVHLNCRNFGHSLLRNFFVAAMNVDMMILDGQGLVGAIAILIVNCGSEEANQSL